MNVSFSKSELRFLRDCVERAIPLLVTERTGDGAFCYCPHCHSILDKDYVAYCSVCGQALRWHGFIKYAHPLENPGPRNHPQ